MKLSEFILSFEAETATVEAAGGKGVNLAEMARTGLPVPPGFIVTTDAYRAFVASNDLQERILEQARGGQIEEPGSLEETSQAIRRLFDQGAVPEEVADAVRQAHRDLSASGEGGSEPPVAVRSSATAEDLPEASFAGQQETFLNVRSEDALLEAVRDCWASLWTARAIEYRRNQDIDPASVSLAVVVQEMIPADVAGILFTVNPVTGNPDEVMLNAAWGLGEAVVSGTVTPDSIIVDKATGDVKSYEVADKDVMTALTEEGTEEVAVDSDRRQARALTDEHAAELVHLGHKLEDHFGEPQDVEWAIAGGEIYVLQSRPVTGLADTSQVPAPDELDVPGDDDWPALGEKPAQPFDLWTRANLGEIWSRPVSPLVASSIPTSMNRGLHHVLGRYEIADLDDIQWAKRFYGRPYFNEGALTHILSEELGLPGSLIDAALGTQRRSGDGSDRGFHPLLFLKRLPGLAQAFVEHFRTDQKLKNLFPQIETWIDAFEHFDLKQLSDSHLQAESIVWAERATYTMNLHIQMTSQAMSSFALLNRLMVRWFDRDDLVHDLVTGLSGVRSAQIAPALWEMAQKLRDLDLAHVVTDNDPRPALDELRDTPEAEPVIEMLDEFLAEHGHRCAKEADWIYPRWVEAPHLVIGMVRGYLHSSDKVNPRKSAARQRERRADAVTWVSERLDPARRAVFQRVLARAQDASRMRDNGKHYLTKLSLLLRQIFVEYGRRCVERGWLAETEDVFFLTLPDVTAVVAAGDPDIIGLDLRELVRERRKAYEYWFDVDEPEVVDADGEPVAVHDEPAGTDGLEGIPASGGRVRGVARIVDGPDEVTRMAESEILVTRSTDPGWTAVFPLVGGLVLEVGGQLSHGAILAREYGVPAVVNVRGAMRRIRDGQTVTVNGTSGHVCLEDGAPEQRELTQPQG